MERRGQTGSAVVEAIISFTGFLFVLFTILNVVNYCRAQTLISHAVDSAAREISQYAYFYKMSGLQKIDKAAAENAGAGADNLNAVIGTVDNLYKSINQGGKDAKNGATEVANALKSGETGMDQINTAINSLDADASKINTNINTMMNAFSGVGSDPLLYMRSMVAVAANETLNGARNYVIAVPLARLFTAQHFGKSLEEASAQLESLGVVYGLDGMNFNMSTIFNSGSDEIHLVVYYKLKLIQFFNFAETEVVVCKEAWTKAWLGGDDVSVSAFDLFSQSEGGGGNNGGGE